MKNVVCLALLLCCGCGRGKPDTLVESGYDQQEMDAAVAKAKSEVERFIEALSQSKGEDFAVKAPIKDGEGVEHFWITDVTYTNGEFAGTINNDPGIVKNVKIGQRWTIKKEEISDWMYFRDGKMHGNYTMRPLFKTMPAEEAAKYRAMLAEP